MARDYSRILTSIWGTDDFTKRSACAQRLYLMLLSQPELSMCGVLTPAPSRWANFAADTSERSVKASLSELMNNGYVIHDAATAELWIRSFVRHDLKLGTPNVAIGMAKAFAAIRSHLIRAGVLQEIRKDFPEGFTKTFTDDVRQRFPKPFLEAEGKAYGKIS